MVLKDILVVELASVLAGPSVGMTLAELGAEVVKVEHHLLGGDVTRQWKLPTEVRGEDRSAYFTSVNWGKSSVGIDLGKPEGKTIVYDLVKQADVVLVSYKPGDAEKLGMDAKTLCAMNERLIYAELTAYGPGDDRVGFDAVIQAEAGFTYMNGPVEGPSVKMPVALMDVLAAHQLREGVLLALLQRERTGKGAHFWVSLIGAGLSSLVNQAANWLVGGKVPQRLGSDHPNIVPYGTIFETKKGGGIVLAIGNDAQFRKLASCLDRAEWGVDSRFGRNPDRVKNRKVLQALLAGRIAEYERDSLLTALHAARVPAGAVRDLADALSQPAAAGIRLEGEGLEGQRTLAIEGLPVLSKMSAPPHLGAQGKTVLQQLGYSDEKIESLIDKGIVGRS